MMESMNSHIEQVWRLRRIRIWLAIFIAGLVLSGLTAFPLAMEMRWLVSVVHASWLEAVAQSVGLLAWVERVHGALAETDARYPFRDPVRNKWVITFGLIACAGVIPLAIIAGQVRGIPLGWRLIDCSFGVGGSVPLLICRRCIAAMEREAS